MAKLTIITINRNNAEGLGKTMESVLSQTSLDFEYIIVDGGSTDDSLQVIREICLVKNDLLLFKGEAEVNGIHVRWISENDNGIYHAMNKGINLAEGDYIQFLNSGDILTGIDVTESMLSGMTECDILYGNMLKKLPHHILCDRGFAGRKPTMLDFYLGTLNHSPAYIKRRLFEIYGLYDESLKIVADYKWFLQVIIMNEIVPVYKNIDVTLFDMNGISTVNSTLDKAERRQVLEEILPLTMLRDYDQNAFFIDQLKRMNRFWFTRYSFYLMERILFKWEKWFKNKEQVF